MKAYIITIIGATLLSAFAGILSPDKWRGYVKLITGLVVISCIVSPVLSVIHSDIFHSFDESIEAAAEGEDLRMRIITSELESRISADIEARMKDEFNISIKAGCSVGVNDDGAVEGVREIRIYGGKLTAEAKRRLCEVYGIEPRGVHDE